MACCKDTDERKHSRKIDQKLKVDEKKFRAEVKILLLGAGESGKSTIARQMKIIHRTGFSEQERKGFVPIIYSNMVLSIKTLVNQAKAKGLNIQDKDAAGRVALLPDIVREMTPGMVSDLARLWAEPTIQNTFRSNSGNFWIPDNMAFYLNGLDRLAADGYVPSEQDVLNSRATTTGIHEIEFDIQNAHFRMIDVGGQRTERRKWIRHFEGVTAVLFCVAMSEYDQKLLEDDETMRMHESLQLFGETCLQPWFVDTAIILFLNKRDIFEEKIQRVPLTVCFPEYPGPNEYGTASKYIQNKFVGLVENTKPIYPHFTCATDTGHIAVVFKAVRDIVLRDRLIENGMM